MYCPYCGNRIPDDSLICEYCGNSLDDVLTNQARIKAERKKKTRKKAAKWPIGLAAVLLAVIVVFAVKSILFTGDETESSSQEEMQPALENSSQEEMQLPQIPENTESETTVEDAGDNSADQQISSESKENSDQENGSVPEEYLIDRSLCYYRSQLNPEEQLMYDNMLAVAISDDPSEPGEFINIRTDPSSGKFEHEFSRAHNALFADHPELFWIHISDTGFNCTYTTMPSDTGEYSISFNALMPLPERKEMIEALESASDKILEDIDLSQPEQIIALQIHDKLIDLVKYDDLFKEQKDDLQNDLAHTAYGALVENSRGDKNTAVCDGYASAYEYLLKKAGIQCISISGIAGDDEETADDHAWNMVKLGNDWYETDCTWDDSEFDDEGNDILREALSDSYYLDTLRHYLFQVTTDRMNSFDPGDDYRYTSDNGWAEFLNSSVHIRNTEEDAEETRDFMTPLAPVAEGTEYSFDRIR